MKKCGPAEELASILHEAGAETEIFSDVVPNCIEVVTAAIQGMKKFGPDGIVALGGGSAIDTAKAAGQLYGAMNGSARPILAAVPTTSGTGSEVTSFAVISDAQAQVGKMSAAVGPWCRTQLSGSGARGRVPATADTGPYDPRAGSLCVH